jgi:hypothetical protein
MLVIVSYDSKNTRCDLDGFSELIELQGNLPKLPIETK